MPSATTDGSEESALLSRVDTFVLDVDGTLVDSNYHHVQAWSAAFAAVGRAVPQWRIHRAIGMGGDRLVAEVAGESTEHAVGEQVRTIHDETYEQQHLEHVSVLPGGHEIISALRQHGFRVVAASSGTLEQTEAALAKVGGDRAVAIGDSVWDMVAAGRLGWPALGVRCGGFAREELLHAGAAGVYDDPADLTSRAWPSG